MAQRTQVYIETLPGPAAELEITRRGGTGKVDSKETMTVPGSSAWDGELGPKDTIKIGAAK